MNYLMILFSSEQVSSMGGSKERKSAQDQHRLLLSGDVERNPGPRR